MPMYCKLTISKIIFLFCLLSAVGISGANAQSNLDAYFDNLLQKRKFMGSVSISHNDSIIYQRASGYKNISKQSKSDTNTKFRIGSITKTFTAALVLKATEENKLQLTDLLSDYYPMVKNSDKITIAHLLKHRSGIVNFTEINGESDWEKHFHTEKQFLAYFQTKDSDFPPGTAYKYSNTNYALLGFILQRIYGKTFAQILEEKIIGPLNLKNTYYSFKVKPASNEAISYNIQNKYIQNGKVNFSNHPASGGLTSTPADLSKFLYALFNGKIINKESLAAMLPANKGEYGMGIEKLSVDNPVGFTHGGRVENYISSYWYFPKEKLSVVTLANATNLNIEEINNTLTRYAFGIKPEIIDYEAIDNLKKHEFEAIKGSYLDEAKKNTITISSNGYQLIFQHSKKGQDYVPFKYVGENIFEYENIRLQFLPENNEVILTQGNTKEVYNRIVN